MIGEDYDRGGDRDRDGIVSKMFETFGNCKKKLLEIVSHIGTKRLTGG
jgi:hypothetical protein